MFVQRFRITSKQRLEKRPAKQHQTFEDEDDDEYEDDSVA